MMLLSLNLTSVGAQSILPIFSLLKWTNQGFHKSDKSNDNQGIIILKLHEDKIIYLSSYFRDTTRFMSWGVVDR